MTVDFPSFCPTRRSLTAGQYAVKNFRTLSGSSTTRLYGSKAFDATLELEYQLSDDEMAEVLKSYHDSYGGFETLNIPSTVYGGMSEDLQEQIRDYYSWKWSQPPKVESIMPGRSRIRISLIGTLDG